MKLILDLDDEQEFLLGYAIREAATEAWRASVYGDLNPDPSYTDEERKERDLWWSGQLAAAETLLAQLPGGQLKRWRESLSDTDDDDEDES